MSVNFKVQISLRTHYFQMIMAYSMLKDMNTRTAWIACVSKIQAGKGTSVCGCQGASPNWPVHTTGS